MIPFLKDRQESAMSGPVESIKRESDDEPEEFGMLDAIVEDMLDAVHKKDKKLLKASLQAFKDHIQDEDNSQDQE